MNDREYFCAILYNEKSSTLFIKSCSEPLKELLGIKDDVADQPLDEYLSANMNRWIYSAFRYLVRGKRSVVSFKELGKNFLAIKMSCAGQMLSVDIQLFNGDKEHFDKLYYSTNLARISGDRLLNNFRFSMILAKRENGFIIDTIDKAAEKAFSVKRNDSISSLFQNFCFIESDRIFRHCLRINNFLIFADVFYDKNATAHHYLIGMIPAASNEKITLTFHSVEQHEYYLLISSCAVDNDIPNSELGIGVAVFKAPLGKEPFLINHNTAYDILTSRSENLYYVFRSLIFESSTTSHIVSVIHRFYSGDCIATAIPFPQDERVFIFITPSFAKSASAAIFGSKLTPRENEIAALISSGKGTADIAAICGISLGTVKKTIANIYSKLNINSRAELVRMVLLHSDQADQL